MDENKGDRIDLLRERLNRIKNVVTTKSDGDVICYYEPYDEKAQKERAYLIAKYAQDEASSDEDEKQ